MTRSKQREHAFLMLFYTEFHDLSELNVQDELYMNELENASETEKAFINSKVNLTREHINEIDELISNKVSGWNINRIGRVELTILRLAISEILYDESIPNGVAINEAVELAKIYGQEDSFSFVNGVLAKFVK